MKKQITVILLSALILSGCASGRMGNPGAIMTGASIGGSLGGSIGGLIGDNNHGWRGGYRGSAIGNIVGTIAGAAIGNALTAPRQEPIEEDAYIPEVREVRVRKYKKQPQVQRPLTQLKLRRIRFIDDNRSHVIDAGENSKIIFEIMNEGRNPVYNCPLGRNSGQGEASRHFSFCDDRGNPSGGRYSLHRFHSCRRETERR